MIWRVVAGRTRRPQRTPSDSRLEVHLRIGRAQRNDRCAPPCSAFSTFPLVDAGRAVGTRDVVGGVADVWVVDGVMAHKRACVGGNVLYVKAEEQHTVRSRLLAPGVLQR